MNQIKKAEIKIGLVFVIIGFIVSIGGPLLGYWIDKLIKAALGII